MAHGIGTRRGVLPTQSEQLVAESAAHADTVIHTVHGQEDHRMFQYTRVRDGDRVPVTYTHESTFDQIAHKLTPEARYDMAFQLLLVIMRERGADRAEWSDGITRVTIEREGVLHAYNSEPTVLDQIGVLLDEALKSDTLTPYVQSRLIQAHAILNPKP